MEMLLSRSYGNERLGDYNRTVVKYITHGRMGEAVRATGDWWDITDLLGLPVSPDIECPALLMVRFLVGY